jgi:ATP-dependent DNA helicase RecG
MKELSMALPINIEDLISHRHVESTRIEYNKGWNPETTLHSICAFANDIDNTGGGYIIIGVEEVNGFPKYPVDGLKKNEIDTINRDIINKCNLIEPRYIPIIETTVYKGSNILVLWVYGGEFRPYKCPVHLTGGKSDKAYYIRKAASTIKANLNEERELIVMSHPIPFDDRPNREANITDLRYPLLSSYLQEVQSSLYSLSKDMTVEQIAESMRLSVGASENVKPRNVGLMFFHDAPDKYFPYARIEVVDKPHPTGRGMTEKTFYGPLNRQLIDALQYIKNYILTQGVIKYSDRAQADRPWNYPYAAIEEILANAVYHKSYEIHEPIIVTSTPEKIEITSIPGPDRSISDADMKRFHMVSKTLRNRRIGDYLKELQLVEGRNTGIPSVVEAMIDNGNDLPIFETDEDRTYLTVILPIHKSFVQTPAQGSQPYEIIKLTKTRRSREETTTLVLQYLRDGEISRTELAKRLGYTSQNSTLKAIINELLAAGELEYTEPNNIRNMFQKLRLSTGKTHKTRDRK